MANYTHTLWCNMPPLRKPCILLIAHRLPYFPCVRCTSFLWPSALLHLHHQKYNKTAEQWIKRPFPASAPIPNTGIRHMWCVAVFLSTTATRIGTMHYHKLTVTTDADCKAHCVFRFLYLKGTALINKHEQQSSTCKCARFSDARTLSSVLYWKYPIEIQNMKKYTVLRSYCANIDCVYASVYT